MNYVYLVLLLAVHGKIISGQGIGLELVPLLDGMVDEIEQVSTLSNNSDSSRISNSEEFIDTRANTTKDITIETPAVLVDVKTSIDEFASTTDLPSPVSMRTLSTDSETLYVSQQSITDAFNTPNTTIASSAIFIYSSSSPFAEKTSQSASQSSQLNFTLSTPNTTILSSLEKTTYSSEQITSADKTTSASEKTTSAAEKTTSATESTTSATEETTSATEEITTATEKSTAAIEKTTPATEKPTSAREKPTPATEKSTNATEKTTPASEKTSIAAEKIITNFISTSSTASVETVTSSVSNSVSTTFSKFVTPSSTRQQTASKIFETTSTVAATTLSNMNTTNSVTVSRKGTSAFDTTSVDEEGISESPLVSVSGGGRTIKMAIAIAFLSIAVLATAAVLVYYLSLRRRPFEYDELRMLP